jgi:UDP-glucose 4-epimerase
LAVYVVTGGAGFIGSHIAEELIRRGERVIVFDNFSTGKRENLKVLGDQAEVREVDLARDQGLRDHLAGVDFVIHQAALPSVPRSIKDPITSHEANVNGTLNLLNASRQAGVRRLVYASSSSLYGDSPTLPKHEGMPAAPLSPYGGQKFFGEVYSQVFWCAYQLETVSLRYFNVFGPRQDPSSQYSGVIARFIPAVLAGKSPVIYGDGEQSRDFTYVSNVVDANLRACVAEGVAGEVFNIACGGRITVNSILDEIKNLIGSDIEPIYEPPRPGDILHSQAGISKARQLLGWTPIATFSEGLRPTIDWYRGSGQ